ncbi:MULTISPECIES: glycosyltransferase [Methylobacterium]|uniref:Glycosyl transferase family 1 domain-containing protein n=9 Tax=Pseudomonadota TaxID=1224 RepID=A0ABQ4SZA5_9HYPH|nr:MULTISPECIES: glycosyltransferase [Methylobacterium]PIU06278.1 MAG: hypothetical protein COT56_10695 [Methylobacterium sp. CG09_land_8_20_14_0_10_71_15]PIU11171.1 MAG: hypothetical protein COT28_21400 [Methylobacterium sp. CG08_land_8_20_14_0_20_71_15]GBU19558.1 hypothetical protein AwMethylo_37730 [Methylobacterium sp.]GJE07546.1 hypothetical protein AOPFMNJM_2875 [Methylobacterium jeotgali]
MAETIDQTLAPGLRVAVFVTNDGATYGGGRLASLLLAHCLARAGCEVHYVTNNKPVFYDELLSFSYPSLVHLALTKDFHDGLPEGRFDVVLLVPTQADNFLFYYGTRGFARRRGARLALFNFETPNWFNAFAPVARDEGMWRQWRAATEDGCLILSNSAESMRYAQSYYVDHPERTAFDYWHQPINLRALETVSPQRRENRIVTFIRALDPHKGGQDVLDALSEDLAGFTLVMIVGSKTLDAGYHRAALAAAERYGLSLEIKHLVSDAQKFIELKRARFLLYPSRFEGYGIPPIEALSCGTPCVCYDLPVFREVCADALHSAPVGDIGALRTRIREVLAAPESVGDALPAVVASVSDILACGQAARGALERYCATPRGDEGALSEPPGKRARRPNPPLVHLSSLALDNEGFAHVRGWTPFVDLGRVELFIDGRHAGRAFLGIDRPDTLKTKPWVGRPDTGFALMAPFAGVEDAAKGTVLVEAFLFAQEGTLLDWTERSFKAKDSAVKRGKLPPKLLRAGGFRLNAEPESTVLHGWIAGNAPPLERVDLFLDGRPVWSRYGRPRKDVEPQIAEFPLQDPGFAGHAPHPLADAKASHGLMTIVAYTKGEGAQALTAKAAIHPAAPPPAVDPALAAPCPPAGLPRILKVRRVTLDEYRVVEFEGTVLARPRIDAMRFHLGDEFLGEGAPDRLNISVFEQNRAYGDVYPGFFFTGRTQGPVDPSTPWRIDLCYGEEVVESLSGTLTPTSRAEAPFGADAEAMPAGMLETGAPDVTVLVVERTDLFTTVAGLRTRALIAAIRAQGRRVLAVLHGNPHALLEEWPAWQALADGLLLVNPLSPLHDPTGRTKLADVLGRLAGQPSVEGFVVDSAAATGALASVDGRRPGRILDGGEPAETLAGHLAGLAHRPLELWTADAARAATLKALVPDLDARVVDASEAALREAFRPWPSLDLQEDAAPILLDATVPLGEAERAALDALGGPKPAAVVDAPPLADEAAIRRAAGLPDGLAITFAGALRPLARQPGAALIVPAPERSGLPALARALGLPVLALAADGSLTPLEASPGALTVEAALTPAEAPDLTEAAADVSAPARLHTVLEAPVPA